MSPGTFRFRRFLTTRELSIFVDESGSQNGHSAFVIVSLVFHEQDEVFDSYISAMEVFGTNYSAFRKNHLKHIQKKEMR